MPRLPLILACLLTACGKPKAIPEAMPPNEQLWQKYRTYQSLVRSVDEQYAESCDGLLFKALTAAGADQPFNIEAHRDAAGKWFRNANHDRCGPTSRDMHMGLMWYMWAFKRTDLVEQEFQYGLDHVFVMDDRDPKISYLLEDHQFTLALVDHELGGKDYTVWKLPAPCLSNLTGFQAHLQALIIGQRALMGHGDEGGSACITAMADRQPNNAFFQAIKGLYTGDQTKAVELLLTERWWPADRLPTSKDRCDDWITQRDESPRDWDPCPERDETYSGGDFLIAARIALGGLR